MDKREYTLNFLREMVEGNIPPDYSEQERAALRGDVPMTQELFEKCLNTCADAGNFAEFLDLSERFPECGRIWSEGLEKDLDAVEAFLDARGIEATKLTDSDVRSFWMNFRERMRARFGDEVADNLVEDITSL